MAKTTLTEREPFESYNHTVHGEAFKQGRVNAAICSDCHGAHDLQGSMNPLSRVYRKNIPATCGKCHENVFTVYQQSIHGKALKLGIKEAPACTDCHGEHTIKSPKEAGSTVWSGAITKTCAGCHDLERITLKFGLPTNRLRSYLDSYHGLASKRGYLHVANCASCHGFHDVLPSTDPRSSIHKTNLAKTCGQCHPTAGAQLAAGFVHGPPQSKHRVLSLVETFYFIIIPLAIGFMLIHNLLDLLRKMIRPKTEKKKPHENQTRLTINERWQHGVLMITFILLAYSGFALKFPEAALVKILTPFNEETRKGLHRWTAFIFCLLGVYHMLYLFSFRQGRLMIQRMSPRLFDIKELWRQLFYYLGLKKEPARKKEFFTYIEKSEYWALIWGFIIMATTGSLLVFNEFTLQYFPLWISELATMVHYYEAILACLAILVWHFYWVIFDPDVYPMNWAWIIEHE